MTRNRSQANTGTPDAAPRLEEPGEGPDSSESRFLIFNAMPSWAVSFIGHVILILLMGFFVLPKVEQPGIALDSGTAPASDLESLDLSLDEDFSESLELTATEDEVVEEVQEVTTEVEVDVFVEDAEAVDFAPEVFNDIGDTGEIGEIGVGNEVSSRSPDSRNRLLREYGGNAASEKAVAAALKWIIDHQLPDGGWSFNHQLGPGRRNSPNPGKLADARIGATALALLPLLGNGQTHLQGTYKKQIQRGLEFLVAQGQPRGQGVISFWEPGGRMYSHGLASIVLTETYALTQDTLLGPYAQAAIKFIERGQDKVGGGWQYEEISRQSDTSVVGWQVMALKSAKLSGLKINDKTYLLVKRFLDSVSTREGAIYGYKTPPSTVTALHRTTSAAGILCRMYMGWKKDHPGIIGAVEYFSELGPDTISSGRAEQIYYTYYAAQVMKQYGGSDWEKWNKTMRDYLVSSQNQTGSTKGSWMFSKTSLESRNGGRLYCTAMACMTLEVYYRYLPLYREEINTDEFVLE